MTKGHTGPAQNDARREARVPIWLESLAATSLTRPHFQITRLAVIKMRATCPPQVVQLGLAALTRTAVAVKGSILGNGVKAEWDVAIAKMRKKLESLPS